MNLRGYVIPVVLGMALAAEAKEPLGPQLEPIRVRNDVPALCAAVAVGTGLVASAVTGVRKRGTEITATLDDRWHLGSDTKAMTASLAGRFVEEGRLAWTSTLGSTFPELVPKMADGWKDVTLAQLLSHRAGLPANLEWARFSRDDLPAARLEALRTAVRQPPKSAPGTKFVYSNAGYVLAGAMIERVTTNAWEREIAARMFGPLGMASAGFGGVGTPGKIDQPWGHHDDGRPAARNGPDMDNPPVLGPAGRVHCTIADWAKFIAGQLRGARGEPSWPGPATIKAMLTPPPGGDYAFGWGVARRDWGGGTVYHHTGCNTMNTAVAWMAPEKDFAVLVCINQGGPRAAAAADEAASALIRWYGR